MSNSGSVESEQGLRAAGWSLAASGVLFLVVNLYLFAVLLPSGLNFGLFDDARGLLIWSHDHLTRYLSLYLIYLAQQVVLVAAPLLLLAHLRGRPGRGLYTRHLAASCGLLSVGLSITSTVLLIMITRTSGTQFTLVTDDALRLNILLTNDVVADMAKGCRVISEVLVGIWIVWLGNALRAATDRRWWHLVTAVGVWTAVVGLWKLMVPTVEFEDWIGFVTGPAFFAAGLGLLRLSRRTAPSEAVPELV